MKTMIDVILLLFVHTLYASDLSGTATLQAPLILSPTDSSVCFFGDTVRFSCVSDFNPPIDSVVWTSDIDGVIGQDTVLSVWTLSEGEHRITVRVKLRNGSILTQEIRVIVRPYDSVDVYCTGEIGGWECGVYWINGVLHEVPGTPNSLNKITHIP